jgi:hypothetical protein
MIEREEQIFELWNKHPFAERTLQTVCGKRLTILSPGILNRDSGPDFFDARIELDGQVWSGNIEIHVRASDWLRHGHTTDKAFSNVVLHVVCVHDCDIYDEHGNVIPVLVLPPVLSALDCAQSDNKLESRCLSDRSESRGDKMELTGNSTINTVGAMQSLESLGVERLYRISGELETELEHLKGDMEALFHRKLFRRFGMRTNSEPFQQLAHRVPGSIIRRERNKVTNLEAILYGQSGLLPDIPVDAYSADLLYRYMNFRYKYNLEPMYVQAWKFMRMRPTNFPTIRISQLAALLHKEEHIYTRCMDAAMTETDLRSMLDVQATEYWDDHFRFGVCSNKNPKQIGEEAVDSILINAVGPLRYFLGLQRGDELLKDSAVELLRELKPENNAAIRQSGRKPMNALQSQGLLEVLTRKGGTNQQPDILSENEIEYFSISNYERNQIHRSDRNVVREQGIRRLRLVG